MKLLNLILIFLLFVSFVNGVTIVENSPPPVVEEPSPMRGIAMIILGGFFFFIFALIFIGIFVFIIWKIYQALSEFKRLQHDFFYSIFKNDKNQCHINRDYEMKYRNWKYLWIFWKRHPLFIKNKDNSYELIGTYNGECLKKENYYCIYVYNKLGAFQIYDYIILIPLVMKDKIVRKINLDGKKVIVIEAEGIDLVENTDYYYIPLIPDPKKSNEFIDFADLVHKTYFEKTTYRDVIKQQLQSYRENMVDAVETNPHIQTNRRK